MVALEPVARRIRTLTGGDVCPLVSRPFDLTDIAVRYQGRDVGAAVPHRIGRHVHPAARPDTPDPDEPKPVTGIDYLKLVHDRHTAALARRVNYAHLIDHAPHADQAPHADEALEGELASLTGLATDSPTAAVLADLSAIADADPANSTCSPSSKNRTTPDDPRSPPGSLRFTRMPYGRALAPGKAAPARQPRRGRRPGRLVHHRTRPWAWSPARSAPARPSRSAPPWPTSTPPGTPPSTEATPPSAPPGSTPASSPALGGVPRYQGLTDPADRGPACRRGTRTRPPVVLVLDEAHLGQHRRGLPIGSTRVARQCRPRPYPE